jgi:hypothetical protein
MVNNALAFVLDAIFSIFILAALVVDHQPHPDRARLPS